MILQVGCYQIRPSKPAGLALYKRVPGGETITWGKYEGQKTKESWRSMDRYPSNYAHALKLIAEDYARNRQGTFNLREGLEDVANYIHSITIDAERLEDE